MPCVCIALSIITITIKRCLNILTMGINQKSKTDFKRQYAPNWNWIVYYTMKHECAANRARLKYFTLSSTTSGIFNNNNDLT